MNYIKRLSKKYKYFYLLIPLLLLIFSYNSIIIEDEQPSIFYTGYGANRAVSGSLHMFSFNEQYIILDAGSFFGDDHKKSEKLPADIIESADAVLISHAHSDHIGRLVELVHLGFNGTIYSSKPTRKLMPVMLAISSRYGDFGQEEFYFSEYSFNRNQNQNRSTPVHFYEQCVWGEQISADNIQSIKSRRGNLQYIDFYLCSGCVDIEVDKVMELTESQKMYEEFEVADNLRAEFFHTPHIPGSVMIYILCEISERSLLYTGDFGSGLSPFLSAQDYIGEADWVIIEGTYGPERRLDPGDRAELIDFLGDKVREGKRIIMPAFVLDRTQQILNEIASGIESNQIPSDIEVRVLSPTTREINRIYAEDFTDSDYRDYFTEEYIEEGPFPYFFSEEVQIEKVYRGEIVLCSSGMADHGYAKDLVKKYIEDPEAEFVFTGYLDPISLGGLLAEASAENKERVEIDGKEYSLRAGVHRFGGFSGHGTFEQISDFLKKVEGLKEVFIVHSEGYTADSLKSSYQDLLPEIEFTVPVSGQKKRLN